jgi:hypothetical protein
MLSLQQITDAWGNWMASQRGTSMRFTEATNYSAHGELGQYHQYQCSAAVQSISYAGNSPPTGGAAIAYELWYDNNTTVQQSETFQYTATSQQSFTWSITESLSIGIEISATEGVPDVASSTQKVSVNLSLSSTQGATSSNTQSWNVNNPVVVPPNSSVKCDMVINSQSYNINFTESVLLAGYVAIWFNDKVALSPNDYHWLWFIPIGSVFTDVISNNLASTEGYSVVAGDQVLTTAQGVFAGSQGVSVGVTTTQYPLRTNAVAENFKGGKKINYYPQVAAGD